MCWPPRGIPVVWCLATPKLGDRRVAAELLGLAQAQGLLRPGMVIAADKGLAGREFAGGIVRAGVRFPFRADNCRLVPRGSLVGVPAWRRGQDAKPAV
jgi:hypothetical protein